MVNFLSGSSQSSTIAAVSDGTSQVANNYALVIIIGVTVGGVVVIILAIIIIAVIVFVTCAKHRLNLSEPTYDLPADYEKPLAHSVETVPPRLEMKENVAYEQINTMI